MQNSYSKPHLYSLRVKIWLISSIFKMSLIVADTLTVTGTISLFRRLILVWIRELFELLLDTKFLTTLKEIV